MPSNTENGHIAVNNLWKSYSLYQKPQHRLKQYLFGRWVNYAEAFHALQNINFNINPGESVGIIGRNGAGKSTLLQLICRTLTPSSGDLKCTGRVAALLELGAGFHPDFTGRENIFLNAMILGLSKEEIKAQEESIIAFSEIGSFIDQPVKTYSSGMFMRLAFSVATAVQPDILIIDEALSVGDGSFARKSFERIMQLKNQGCTLLFCSHAMYQVESICSRAIWLENGTIKMDGPSASVTNSYQASLNADQIKDFNTSDSTTYLKNNIASGTAHFTKIEANTGGESSRELQIKSNIHDLHIDLHYLIDSNLPPPVLAIGITDKNGLTISSATTMQDHYHITNQSDGVGHIRLTFPQLPLLKGQYFVSLFLFCENALHIYDQAINYLCLEVEQDGLEQGFVRLPHSWHQLNN